MSCTVPEVVMDRTGHTSGDEAPVDGGLLVEGRIEGAMVVGVDGLVTVAF
jgi:hypothetical protein